MKKYFLICLLSIFYLTAIGQVTDASLTTKITTFTSSYSTYTNDKTRLIDLFTQINSSKLGKIDTQTANTIFSGPTTGSAAAPTFRSLVLADLPTVTLTKGGTASSLSDPGANRLWGWDDTDNTIGFWTIGSGLTYTHSTHTLSASGGTLTNGNATTANGTAVDLGGVMTANVDITGSHDVTFGGGPFNGMGDFTIWTAGTFKLYSDALSTQIEISNSGVSIQATLTTLGDTRLSPFISGSGGNYYNITGGSIAADREIRLPNLSAADIFAVLNTEQEFGAKKTFFTSSLSSASINIPPGVAPSSPNAGDVWTTTTHLFTRLNGVTYQLDQQTPSGAALTKVDDTNITLTLGGTPATALLQASSITVGWSGTLAYSRFVNGTGLSVVGRSANTSGVQADIVGTANQVLRVSGTTLGFGAVDLAAMVGATILPPANGGTGVANNAASTITISGSFGTTFTVTGTTGVTLPTTGTLSTLSGAESLTNKKLGSLTTNGFVKVSSGDGTLSGTPDLTTTFSAANTITGSTTNIFKMVFPLIGVTTTDGAGIWLTTTTAAAAGAQQEGGSITLESFGWATNSGGSSQSVKWRLKNTPAQGTANPTSALIFQSNINAAGYSDIVSFGQINNKFGTYFLMQNTAPAIGVQGGGGINIDFYNNVNGSLVSAVTSGTKLFTMGDNSSNGNVSSFSMTITPPVQTSAWRSALLVNAPAHTGMTAAKADYDFNGARAVTYTNNGTIASQSYGIFRAPTSITGTTGTTTFTEIQNVLIEDLPAAGSGAAFTAAYALNVGKIKMGIPKFAGTNSTGAGSALLGANSPAVTLTAPYTWITVITSDGSTGYIPVWK